MWFWSVPMVDQLSGQFLIFFGRPKENCPISETGQFFFVHCLEFYVQSFLKKTGQKIQESEQKRSETGQIFFSRPKKVRNRPDNWSTKRLTKTTWTGLWSTIGTDQNHMDAPSIYCFILKICQSVAGIRMIPSISRVF